MKIKKKASRVLALLLALTTLFSIFQATVLAATIADGSKNCTVEKKERNHYLKTTAGNAIGASGYKYTTNDGVTGVAYCINWGLAQTSKPLEITGKYTASPATIGAFANGYPQRSLADFLQIYSNNYPALTGLTEEEFLYATQVAIWATLGQLGIEGTSFTSGRATISNPAGGTAQQLRVFAAITIILSNADDWTKPLSTGMYVSADEATLKNVVEIPAQTTLQRAADRGEHGIERVTIGGTEYFTRAFSIASATSTWPNNYHIHVWGENAPAGTIFVDANNQPLTRGSYEGKDTYLVPTQQKQTTRNENGTEYSGLCKIAIPVNSAGDNGNVTIRAGGTITQYDIYLAHNPVSTEQSYIISDPGYGDRSAQGTLTWTNTQNSLGRLLVQKVDGVGNSLEGAEFTLTGSDGSTYTGKTNKDGQISWNNLNANATYVLTETKAPAGFGIVGARNVTVTANQTTHVTVKNTTEKRLTIKKTDAQNGYSLQGAVFAFEQIDGTFQTTATTGHDGTIQLDPQKLPIGSYRVYETAAPEGYEKDNGVQTVHWTGQEDITLHFKNVRKPTLLIYKEDADTGAILPGAVFEVYRDGQRITTVTTDDAGLARVTGVTEGLYQVKEIAAPQGYVLDSAMHSIYVNPYDPAAKDDPILIIPNRAKPGLQIVKFDAQTMQGVSGVTFEVYRDTTLIGNYTTDMDGEIYISDLEPGTYLVREVAANDNYVVNSTPQQIELTPGGGIARMVFLNFLKPGMHLVKLDRETMQPLVNATFLIEKIGGTFSKEYTTDQNGEIDLSKLEPGAYTVTETKAPEGYLIDDAVRTIQINEGENAQFVFTNTKKPSLVVVKYDPNLDKYLPGATFQITKIEDGSHYLDRVTDVNGTLTIDNLEPGVYSVREITPPEGYILNPQEYHVELFAGKQSQLVVTNQAKPDLLIIKQDAKTGKRLPGASFTIKKADDHTVTTVTTDQNGEALLTDLSPGAYVVYETVAPNGYLLNDTQQMITLLPNRTGTVVFENHPKPALTVNKVDSITGDPLQGVKFRVTYASNNTDTGEINDLGYYYTDETGQFHLTDLRDGWYKVTEVESIPGYAIQEPAAQEIYIKAGESKTLTFENTPLSALVIYKYDSVTGEAIPNAVFQVKYLSGTSGTGGTVIGTYKTSINGSFTVTGLKAGTYIVEELASDERHVIDTAPQTAYLSGKDQDVVQLYFGNSPKGALLIKKIDSVTHKPLSDVEFFVTTSEGTIVGTGNGKYVTDSAGSILIDNLDPGTTLVVKETIAKAGYVLDDAPQTVKIKAGETVTLEFRNQPIGGLTIIKKDEQSGNRISGVQFEVRKMNGAVIGQYTTDRNGMIQLPGLEKGWYTVTELKAAPGYLADLTPQQVQVKDGQIATLEITNPKASHVLLHKVDGDTGKGIQGGVFLLYDSNQNPIGQYVTDQNGYIYMDEDLEDGRYYIREIKAPEGYVLDDTLKTIYIQYGSTTEIEWENTAIRGQIQIIKKSADHNPINALPAGTLLEGAVFEVYDKAGNKVDTIKTDRNGRATSKPLPLSRYTIREVQAPAHYSINPTVLTAYLEHEGQIVTFEVEDDSISTGVSIKKTGYREVVPGQPIKYTITGIANTSTVPLSSFYWRDALPGQVTLDRLVTGTYNEPLSYKIVYQTNLSGESYRTLADNLSTTKNYVLDASPATLGLAANERITQIMFVFGTVKAGFAQVETPYIHAAVAHGLANGESIVNVADVGGVHNGQWIMGTSRWLTTVYAKTILTLPKTGY